MVVVSNAEAPSPTGWEIYNQRHGLERSENTLNNLYPDGHSRETISLEAALDRLDHLRYPAVLTSVDLATKLGLLNLTPFLIIKEGHQKIGFYNIRNKGHEAAIYFDEIECYANFADGRGGYIGISLSRYGIQLDLESDRDSRHFYPTCSFEIYRTETDPEHKLFHLIRVKRRPTPNSADLRGHSDYQSTHTPNQQQLLQHLEEIQTLFDPEIAELARILIEGKPSRLNTRVPLSNWSLLLDAVANPEGIRYLLEQISIFQTPNDLRQQVSDKLGPYEAFGQAKGAAKKVILNMVGKMHPNEFHLASLFPAITRLVPIFKAMPQSIRTVVLRKTVLSEETYWPRLASLYAVGGDIVPEQDRYVNGAIEQGKNQFVAQTQTWMEQPKESESYAASRLIIDQGKVNLIIEQRDAIALINTHILPGDPNTTRTSYKVLRRIEITQPVNEEGVQKGQSTLRISTSTGQRIITHNYVINEQGQLILLEVKSNGVILKAPYAQLEADDATSITNLTDRLQQPIDDGSKLVNIDTLIALALNNPDYFIC